MTRDIKKGYQFPTSLGTHPISHRERERSWSYRIPALAPHDELRELLQLAEITLTPGSRFLRYFNDASSEGGSIANKRWANLEIAQMLAAVGTVGASDPWRPLIVEALTNDIDILADSQSKSKGRDTQFEVYLAGRLAAIGIDVRPGEPDLVCDRNGFRFTVAAKRLKSRKKLLTRVSEARRQIDAVGLPGVIALDLTPIYHFEFQAPLQADEDELMQAGPTFLDLEHESAEPRMRRVCIGSDVIGTIGFAITGSYSRDLKRGASRRQALLARRPLRPRSLRRRSPALRLHCGPRRRR